MFTHSIHRILRSVSLTARRAVEATSRHSAVLVAIVLTSVLSVSMLRAQPARYDASSMQRQASFISASDVFVRIFNFVGIYNGDQDGKRETRRPASPDIEPKDENLKDWEIPEPLSSASAIPCAPSGNPTILVPGTYPTIQQAIDNADPAGGDTIQVAAGTYTEQLVINKCVTIKGASQATTIIQSPAVLANSSVPLIGANRKSIVEIAANSYVTMKDLTVTGPLPFSATRVYGIFVVQNATLKMSDSRVTAIHQTGGIDGVQNGGGIAAGNSTYNQIGSIDLDSVTVDNVQKTGIIVDRVNSTGTITNSTISGIGPTTIIAQNGIQFSGNASGSVTNSSINGHEYTPNTYSSAGILPFDARNVTASGNTFSGNDVGIYGYNSTIPSPLHLFDVTSNTFSNHPDAGIIFDATVPTISNNVITGANWGIGGFVVNGQASVIKSNSITAPVGAGPVGIYIDDWDTGSPTTTATSNVSFNRISGHTNGFENNTASALTTENNFWGCNAGPGNAGCDPVVGTGVTDANPWLTLTGIVAAPTSVNYSGASTISSVSLRINSDSVDTYSPTNHVLDGIAFPFTTAPGTAGGIAPSSGTFVSGLASGTTFTAGVGPFVGNQVEAISATLDNQSISANVTVLDTTAPTVNLSADGPNPTNTAPVTFTATFSEPVSGFTTSGVSLTGTNAPGATVSSVTQIAPFDGTTWSIVVSGMTGSGNITTQVIAAAAVDTAVPANPNTASGTSTVGYFTGSLELVVEPLGINCLFNGAPVYTTIQAAINAASAGYTIRVCPGTYDEDVDVNKSLTLIGVNKTTTIIRGQKVGDPAHLSGSTVRLLASNIDISNFTITREGNTPSEWGTGGGITVGDPNLAGLSIQSPGSAPNAVIHDNIFVGNRNGLDLNNTGTDSITVRNNVIDDNRTGVILRNQTDNVTFVENSISENWTIGVLFLDGSGGTNIPVQSCKDCAFINNDISGNWYAEIQDRQQGGALPAPGTTNWKNFQGNWYGTATPNVQVTPTNTTEPGYTSLIPVGYGGTATDPGGQPDIAGSALANLRFNLPLTSGADTDIQTETGRGTFGFQGAPIVVASAPTFPPTAGNGWFFFNEGPGGSVSSGDLELNPAGGPTDGGPLPNGSARLTVDANGRMALGTLNYGGIKLSDITRLTYSSWQQSPNAATAPALQFDVKSYVSGAAAYEGRLVFEPYQTPGNTVQQGVWQDWDAIASGNGRWWGSPGVNVGDRPISDACPQSAPCTWTTIVNNFGNATIRPIANNGVLMFRAGGPVTNNFTGFVDNFEIGVSTGNSTFDFQSDGNDVPTVVSSVRSSTPDPSSASSVDFTVTFSEPVTGLDTGDFTLFTSGVTGASVTSVTPVVLTYTPPLPALPSNYPSQTAFVVTVNTGSGSGTIRLDTVTSGLIEDLAGNDLTTGFTTGEFYTMDRDAVTVTVDHVGQADPTSVAPIKFRAIFSEAVTGFGVEPTDVVVSGSAGATTASITEITPNNGTTYEISVPTPPMSGFVTVAVAANAAVDILNNPNSASTAIDDTVNYTTGSAVLMVDTDGLAIDGDCNSGIPNTAYTTIQAAVAAAGPTNTIKVCPGGAGDYMMNAASFSITQNGLTIENAIATKPKVNVSGTGSNITVLASGVTIKGIKIHKTDTAIPFPSHDIIAVQGASFTGQDLDFVSDIPWSGGGVSRAFVVSPSATTLNLVGNTITDFRQPAYITGDSVTVMGNITGNTATRTKGWVVDEALLNFNGNIFGVTCPNCDADIALISYFNNSSNPASATMISHYSPYLTLSSNNDNAFIRVKIPQDPQPSGRATTYVDDGLPAINPDGRTLTQYRSTIQDAINNTLPGGTVNVAAGTYTEQITVNRRLNILGPNSAIDPNTGSRVAEAVIRAAVKDADPFDGADDENSVMVTITNTADGTVFKGFTLDGDNPLLDSNYELNGADVDAFGGISGNGNLNPAFDISYNIIKNMGEFGIELYGDENAPGARTNSNISNNKIDNVVGWWYGNAIVSGDNALANVSDNVVTQSFAGVMIQHINGNVSSQPGSDVNNNTITAFGYPIWFNLHYGYSGNGYTVSNNTVDSYVEQDAITFAPRASNSKFEGDKKVGVKLPRRISENEPQNAVGGWNRFIGIKIESVNGFVPATFSDNYIDGNRLLLDADGYNGPGGMIDGIRITNPSTTSTNIDIKENNITDTNRGIAHTADAVVDITCNNIYGNQIGVYIGNGLDYDGNPESADAGANVNNNNLLGNVLYGVQAETGTSGVNNATGNYWGATDGPGPIGPGTGDKVSSLVDYSGFLTIPSTCSPVAPPPTVTINQKVGQADPTNVQPVEYTVVFSEAVTDFTDSDVTLSGTALATTAVVTEVAPNNGTTYNVAVTGMSAVGTVIATVPAGATTTGASGANVASTSTDNSVVYDAVAPIPTIDDVVDATSNSPVSFTVDFGEPVTGFTAADVDTSASTTTGTLNVVVTPAGPAPVYNVAITGMTSSGNVVMNFVAGVANDLASNPSAAPTVIDNSVTFTLVNTDVVVSSAATLGWGFLTETASGTGSFATNAPGSQSGAGSFGTGSARLTVNDVGGQVVGKIDYAGTKLADITELKYSTYQNITTATSFQFAYDLGVDGGYFGRIVYEPVNDPGAPAVLANTWQEWNVLSPSGHFWATGALSGVCPNGNSNPACTLSGLLTAYPNLRVNNNTTFGAILFKIGSRGSGSPAFDGRVDKFVFGINSANTTFDFEDEPPTISVNDVTFSESGTADFTVSLTGDLPTRMLPISVTVNTANVDAVAPGDYGAVVNQVVTFAPGTSTMPVSISIASDTIDEPNETFRINLTNAVNAGIADAQGIGTITDDDATPVASIADASTVTEGDSGTQTTTFTVSLTNASSQPITLNITPGGAANSAGNVTVETTSVTFPADSAANQTVSASVYGDNLVEGNQNYTATISVGSGTVTLGTSVGTGTITDDDAYGSLQFSSPTYGVTEGTPTATFAVTRTGGNDGAVSATCSITPGGTANSLDYGVITSVSFADQDSGPQNCTLPITDDIISEVPETVNLLISAPLGGATIGAQNTAVLTITDNDGGGVISISGNVTAYTGGAGIVGVTMTLVDGVNPPLTTTTGPGGAYTFSGLPSGGNFNITPTCPSNPLCVAFEAFDASARQYLGQFSSVTGANFEGYDGDNPRDITFVTTTQPSFGSSTTVPITMVSRGTENSMTFRLTYDPTKLVFQSAACGAGAPGGCTVTPTSGPAATPGSLTLALDLGPGVTFAAGLREAMTVTFGQGPSVTVADYNAPVTFAASPRAIGNVDSISVPADYFSGLVVFAQGKEGDIHNTVTPGFPDGFIDGADVNRIRSLAVNNSLINNTINEFQRADSNIYVNKGDGYIDGLDITQVRRYVSIDPHQSAGGPGPAPFAPFAGSVIEPKRELAKALAPNNLRIVSRGADRGQVIQVAVELETGGNENVVQFSIEFDPTRLSMSNVNGITKGADANLGSDLLDPVYSTNGQDYTAGRVGAILTRNPGTTFGPAGTTKQVVILTFTVNNLAPLGNTDITFRTGMGFSPRNLLGDVDGIAIPGSTFTLGTITIFSAPTSSNATVAGVVTNSAGIAVPRAQVSLAAPNGTVYRATTNGLGNFMIENVPVDTTYVLTVGAKGYTFSPRTINVNDNIGRLELRLE